MAKKETSFFNMVLTLFLVTLISATALGFVYELTKEPIDLARILKKNNAIQNVIPGFNNNPIEEASDVIKDGKPVKLYMARENGDVSGIAVETFSNEGFNGEIKLMVGFLPDGTINGVTVLEHKETPGLGDKMVKSKSDFSNQFVGKHPDKFKLQVKKDGGDVDAITAATISSRAFCDAVDRAYQAFKQEELTP